MEIKTNYDLAAGIGMFLQSKGEHTYGVWSGKVTATEQRTYFGCFMGKGTLHVDGQSETIEMTHKVCFGTDTTTIAMIDAKAPANSYCNDISKTEIMNFIQKLKA